MADRSVERQSDAELIRRCLAGDQGAYQKLLEKYRRQVLSLVWRMVSNREEAQDLAQEAFIRAFRSLHTFDTERSFPAWLFRITTNLCVDFYRRKKLDTVPLVQGAGQDHEERVIEIESRDLGPDDEYEGKSSAERWDRMRRRRTG